MSEKTSAHENMELYLKFLSDQLSIKFYFPEMVRCFSSVGSGWIFWTYSNQTSHPEHLETRSGSLE